jgi:hypothetical protein
MLDGAGNGLPDDTGNGAIDKTQDSAGDGASDCTWDDAGDHMTKGTWDNATDDALDMAADKTCNGGAGVKVKGAEDEQDNNTVNTKLVSLV